MKEWPINTPNGGIDVSLDFFRKINIKEIKDLGGIIFITCDGHTFSILERNWKEIQSLLREDKINKILNML